MRSNFFGSFNTASDRQEDDPAQGQDDMGEAGAADEEHGEDDGRQGQGGAEVGLDADQADEEPGHQHVGQKADGEILHLFLFAGKGVGQEQDHRDLGELRRLQGEGPQADPAGRAPHLAADTREKHQDQAESG